MGLFSSIGGLFTGNKAAKGLNKDLRALYEENKFDPYNVSGPLGSGSFEDGVGTAQLSPALQASFNQFGRLTRNLGARAQRFNPASFQNDYFSAIDRLASRREADQFSNLESKLFNSSGINTGTERMVADFQQQLGDARYARQQQAVTASQDFFSDMLNQLLGVEQGRLALGASALDPLKAGANFGQIEQAGNLSGAEFAAQGAGIRRGAQANTGAAIGGIFDDAITGGLSGGWSGFGKSFFG